MHECAQYFPTQFTVDDLSEATTKIQLSESLLEEGLEQYRSRDETFPGGEAQAREIERDVMLQIIDQRWRDHLAEMDYLREGINLRAMGQQDPLVAWQKEGYDMFGQMMENIDDDYLRYVLHVQVIEESAAVHDLAKASYQAADDPVIGSSAFTAIQSPDDGEASIPSTNGGPGSAAMAQTAANRVAADGSGEVVNTPLMKSPTEKLGRNEPCWCGSGKKFKLCHGRV